MIHLRLDSISGIFKDAAGVAGPLSVSLSVSFSVFPCVYLSNAMPVLGQPILNFYCLGGNLRTIDDKGSKLTMEIRTSFIISSCFSIYYCMTFTNPTVL